MKTYSALEVRKRFGEILDEAAAGERIVIERAGMPVAGLVPLADLEEHDPARRRQGRLAALARLQERARLYERGHGRAEIDAATIIRQQRLARDEQVMRAVRARRSADESTG